MAHIYIAASLADKERANELGTRLEAEGHVLTAPWFRWPPVGWGGKSGTKGLRERGEADLRGVREADLLYVILPGGRGTHVELGLALAWGKQVILWTPEGASEGEYPCVFHYLPSINRQWHATLEHVVSLAKQQAPTTPGLTPLDYMRFAKMPARAEPSPCLHDQCPDCQGTGVKRNGSFCVHAISCPCPRCTARC